MLAILLLSVTLAAPFGDAEAAAVDLGPPLQINLSVEVDGPREAVLARMVSRGGELDPVALVPHGDGTWSATVRLTAAEDLLVAFEAIPSAGEAVISTAHRLTELGVDPAVFAPVGTSTTAADDGDLPDGWLLAAIAAALGALLLLSSWALPRRGKDTVDDQGRVDLTSGNPDLSGEPDHLSTDLPDDDPAHPAG